MMLFIDPTNAVDMLDNSVIGAILILSIFGLFWFVRRFDSLSREFIEYLKISSKDQTEAMVKVTDSLHRLIEGQTQYEIQAVERHSVLMAEVRDSRSNSNNGHHTHTVAKNPTDTRKKAKAISK